LSKSLKASWTSESILADSFRLGAHELVFLLPEHLATEGSPFTDNILLIFARARKRLSRSSLAFLRLSYFPLSVCLFLLLSGLARHPAFAVRLKWVTGSVTTMWRCFDIREKKLSPT
jgi:hypothetical protein